MNWGFGNKGWTAIDFGRGDSVSAVSVKTAARHEEKPQVVGFADAHIDGANSPSEKMRELLPALDRRMLQLVTLACGDYRLRVMPEPAVPPREMLSSLRWTLSTEFETGFDDLSLAWMRIPTEEQLPLRPRQVYVVMASKTLLNERMASWRQVGVKPRVVDIRETALRNLCGALESGDKGLALVSVDHAGVHVVFTYQGALYLDRTIELPLADMQAADAAGLRRLQERVAEQVARSIDVIGRNFSFMSVQRVLVAPEPASLGLAQVLAERLPVAVEPLDLAQVFDLSPVPELAQSPALQARCLVALGATLRPVRALS